MLAEDDNGGGNPDSYFQWQAPKGGTYFIRVMMSPVSAYGCDAEYDVKMTQTIRVYLPFTKR
jgi:hypothetical protein